MSVLTENIVLSRTRAQDLNSVRKLNCWGSELTDVCLVRRMTFVEVLSLSVNNISTLLDFSYCKNLQELYIRKNCITDLNEVIYLKDLPRLKSLWLADNPCAECDHYRMTVLRALPNLQKLDNISVQPQEVEIAKCKGKILAEPSEKKDDEDSEDQIIPVQTAHIKKEKVEESKEKASPDKNQNQDMAEDTRRNNQTPPNPMFETAVPKHTKTSSPPKVDQINREMMEDHKMSIQNQQYVQQQQNQVKQQQLHHQDVTVHRQMMEQREQHAATNISGSATNAQHVNHAFYARVQTLVDHSSRKPRKPSDLRCEGRSNKSMTSSPPPPLPSNGIDESPDNYQLGDMEGSYYGGSGPPGGRDLSELETRSCSLDSEASYYLEQRAVVGTGTNNSSRIEKGSPTRILPKGGRNRVKYLPRNLNKPKSSTNIEFLQNSNILSAVLCLIKELDFASLEVVETAIHCQMEDMENP